MGLAIVACAPLLACVTPEEQGLTREGQEHALLQALESVALRHEAQGQYTKAAEQFVRLVTQDPNNETYILGVARNQRRAGAPREALSILRRALAENRVDATVPIRLEKVRALLASGLIADARQEVSTLRKEAGDTPEVLGLAGLIADRDGDFTAAQAAYRQALDLTPDNLAIANNLALSLALSGNLDEAIALQIRTAGHPLAAPKIRQNLALLYALAGNMAEATRITRDTVPSDQVDGVLEDLRRLSGRGGDAMQSLQDGPAM